jgi:hypothetical protein
MSPPCSPTSFAAHSTFTEHGSQFLIAPLSFVSFLISLALVDQRFYRQRSSQTSSPPDSKLSKLRSRVFKSQPYAVVRHPDGEVTKEELPWERAQREKEGGRYERKKKRKLFKMEITQAVAVSKRMRVVLALTGVAAIGTVIWGIGWLWMHF